MLHDVAVVGAGPVGATLALALADTGLDVVVLDARRAGEVTRADRSLALSHGARLILERLSVWRDLARDTGAATPITRIDVSQAGGFGALALDAEELGWPALGYVVRYRALQAALDAAIVRSGVAVRRGCTASVVGGTPAYAAVSLEPPDEGPVLARLAAVADGSGAAMAGVARVSHDYEQVALVAAIASARPHGGTAYERFTPGGPLALLPEGDRYTLVWTVPAHRADRLRELSDAAFVAEVGERFGARAGGFTAAGERRAFPLVLEFARDPVGTRCVALGNAAQTLHPVAGQGFNVGLRDAYELAQIVADSPRDRLGDREMLDRYRRARRVDRGAGIAFTHTLVRVFGNDLAVARWPRGLALALLETIPVAKRAFTRAMLFGLR